VIIQYWVRGMRVSHMRLLAIFIAALSCPAFLMGAEDESALPPDPPDLPAKKGRELLIAAGFEYGFLWGGYSDGFERVKAHKTVVGLDVFLCSFRDGRAIGFFIRSFAGDASIGTVNGVRPEYSDYIGEQFGLLLGPVFRHELNEHLGLLCGIGPGIYETSQGYTQYAPLSGRNEYFLNESFNIGIGADIMLKYAIKENLLLFFGCTVTLDFLRFFTLEARPSNPALAASGRVKDFFMLGIRPYIAIGCKL